LGADCRLNIICCDRRLLGGCNLRVRALSSGLIQLAVFIILKVYAKLGFVTFGVVLHTCTYKCVLLPSRGTGFGDFVGFRRVSKLEAIATFQCTWNME